MPMDCDLKALGTWLNATGKRAAARVGTADEAAMVMRAARYHDITTWTVYRGPEGRDYVSCAPQADQYLAQEAIWIAEGLLREARGESPR